jgi:hypothetical protein
MSRIASLRRYPIKSMLGEEIPSAELGEWGIPGDRGWAVRDEKRGEIASGRRVPGLLHCAARFGEAAPEIELPDGSTFLASDQDASTRLSAAVGTEVTLWPPVPAEQLDHYQRAAPEHADMETELRAIFARLPDESLPDLSKFPPDGLRYTTPPGTYFDASPLLLLTTRSLETLARARPESSFDVRRFRPNLLIDTDDDGDFPEYAWVGKRLRVGGAVLKVDLECPRCILTTHALAELPEDPGIMRALVSEAGGNLGVYTSVEEPGPIRAGDRVELI